VKRILAALAALLFLVAQTRGDAPSVTIYPFTSSVDIDPQAGNKLAFFIAARLNQTGGVVVKQPEPQTQRTAYLDAARKIGADYYVAGYVTPLGSEATLVVQLVSTTTGISVWSNTSEVRTYEDASATADAIHTAMLLHFVHQLPTYTVHSPSPGASVAPTAQPAKNTAAVTVTAAPVATPSAAPATAPPNPARTSTPQPTAAAAPSSQPPTVAAAVPAGGPALGRPLAGPVIVVLAGGSAVDSDRAAAARSLVDELNGRKIDATLDDASSASDLPAQLSSLCAEYRVPSILTGSLANSRTQAVFEMQRYDCGNGTLTTAEATARGGGKSAISAAVRAALTNYLKLFPPPTGPAGRPAS
jgi:TolB-like protein